jgi:hypothetical protein
MGQGLKFLIVLHFVLLSALYAKPGKTGRGLKPTRKLSTQGTGLAQPKKESTPATDFGKPNPTSTSKSSEEPAQTTSVIQPIEKKKALVKNESSSFRWNLIQAGGGVLFDSEGGNAGAIALIWNPNYRLTSNFSLKAYAGGMLSNLFAGNSFGVGDLALNLKCCLGESLWGEAGGGLQYWTGKRHRNIYPQAKAALGYNFFQVTYSSVFDSLLTTHQVMGSVLIKL